MLQIFSSDAVISIPTLANNEFTLPRTLSRLIDLAYNVWWSWSNDGRALWATIDPVAWDQYHNPIELLSSIERGQWYQIEQLEAFHERYQRAINSFDEYMTDSNTWYHRAPNQLGAPVAYLCTEFGVHESLPFYSGGLGILAGDHLKAASDLGVPLVGVGLLYRRGYFRQEMDSDGGQQHFYPTLDLRRLPVLPVEDPAGGQLKIPIEFPGREVWAGVWKLNVGRVALLLLDTDVPENDPSDRPITHQLYIAGREMRFCQELVLGVGAVRALEALGIRPGVWHVNEGHAAMSVLERAAIRIKTGESLDSATKALRAETLFTLHTPVPAGNEVFATDIAAKYLSPWAERIGQPLPELLELAVAREGAEDRFDLGALAIRFSSIVNGVSKRHGAVVTEDWRHLIGGEGTSVTNGVHTPTWVGREGGAMLRNAFGPNWPTKVLDDPALLDQIDLIPDETVWNSHLARKELFTRFARGRLRRQYARLGASPDELSAFDSVLPTDRLTLGFARRFATYKRATLMFADRGRLRAILTNPERPIQIVFAGKAHPADRHGQGYLQEISELSHSDDFRGHVFVLEDYDARMARFMVQGVDVWVNTPRPPMEASGTSGMKAAINGGLNLSVLDGWWIEGFNGKNGWAFGSPDGNGDWAAEDHEDSNRLYELLEHEVAPLYYRRAENDLPLEWIGWMREAIKSSLVAFSTHRMVADYYRHGYLPLATDQPE